MEMSSNFSSPEISSRKFVNESSDAAFSLDQQPQGHDRVSVYIRIRPQF
jgi:kinesin family member 5